MIQSSQPGQLSCPIKGYAASIPLSLSLQMNNRLDFLTTAWQVLEPSASLARCCVTSLCFGMQNAIQAAKVLSECNALLRSPNPLNFSTPRQPNYNHHSRNDADSMDIPKPSTFAAAIKRNQAGCSTANQLENTSRFPHSSSDDDTDDDKVLSLRKRLRTASTATMQQGSGALGCRQTELPSTDSVMTGANSTVGSLARAISCSPARQPQSFMHHSVQPQSSQHPSSRLAHQRVAMDPSSNLHHAAANASAAASTVTTSPPVTESAQAERAIVSNDAVVAVPSAPATVTLSPTLAGNNGKMQCLLLAGLIHHYSATKGPAWLFCLPARS